MLITCEHASNRLPAGLRRDGPARALLRSHHGWDIGIWNVAREISRLMGATAIGGGYSRLVVDLNRDPADRGSILAAVDDTVLAFNAKVGPKEAGRRFLEIHAPYHAEIDWQLARRSAAGVRTFLISFHSFTPHLNPRRRRFHVGVLFRDHARLARRLGRALAQRGFSVRYNRPYSGLEGLIYAASRHGANRSVPYLELEFNQGLLGSIASCRDVARRAAQAIGDMLGAC